MTFPKRAAAAIAGTDTAALPGVLATGDRVCAGAKFHSPNPLLLTEVSTGGEALLLCGTCLANLRVYQHLLRHTGGDLPWEVRRDFGNQIRAIALRDFPDLRETMNEDEVAGV